MKIKRSYMQSSTTGATTEAIKKILEAMEVFNQPNKNRGPQNTAEENIRSRQSWWWCLLMRQRQSRQPVRPKNSSKNKEKC
jgi:hypothetical protein